MKNDICVSVNVEEKESYYFWTAHLISLIHQNCVSELLITSNSDDFFFAFQTMKKKSDKQTHTHTQRERN